MERAATQGPLRGRRGILHDLGILTLAQVAAQLLNVVALVYLARLVGAAWFGVLQVGVAFSAYALIAAEWGMWALGIREIARLDGRAEIRGYAAVHLGIMSGLAAVVLLGGLLLLPLLPAFDQDPWVLLLYLLAVVPQVMMLDWIGIGLERMTWVGIVKVCRSLFYAVLVLALLGRIDGWLGWPAHRWVPVMFLAGFVASNRIMASRVRRWLGGPVLPAAPRGQWRRRLVQATPIGAGNLTVRVVVGVDVILLGLLADAETVGSYAAAAKLLFIIVIAVEVLWKALLPRLARLWRESPDRFRRRVQLYVGMVAAAFLPVAAGGWALGDRLMAALYPESFGGAGPVFRILSFSYVALALGMFFGNVLIASDRQRAWFPPLLLSAALAVAGNLLLVPRWGALGACWAMLTAHAALLAWTAWLCRRSLGRPLLWPLGVAIGASLAMVAALRLAPAWHPAALVGAGVAVYAVVAGWPLARWARSFR